MDKQNDQSNEENPVSPIDLTIFTEHISQTFLGILDSMPDQEKLVVIAKPCISQLNYFLKMDQLKQRKVPDKIEILNRTLSKSIEDIPIIIYILPSEQDYIQLIEEQMNDYFSSKNKNKNSNINTEFHLIFIPKITNKIQTFIKQSEYRSYYNIHNLNIDMYSLDYDLISLEDHFAFYNFYINDNLNNLTVLTNCILKYESMFGKIKYKYYKGSLSKKLNELLLKEEESLSFDEDQETLGCIILDRKVDMITPFCTPFTYEGLLDEFFGINFNSIRVPPKILEKESKDAAIKIDLGISDKFYTNIKDYNFSKIRTFLPGRLQEHSKILEEGKTKMSMKKIQENLEKVKQIKEERQSLTNHINLADYIAQKQKEPNAKYYLNNEQSLLLGELSSETQDFIDNELSKKAEEYTFLKILCLLSSTQSGIKSKTYDQIKREFFQIYGFQEIFLWRNLEKANILKSQHSSNYYKDAEKRLKLIYEDINLNEPNDTSYAYSGYAPITIRLIEKAINNGWGTIVDILSKLPGEYEYPKNEREFIKISEKRQFILLVFIGGITYGELSAIRYMNQKNKNKKFIILTTDLINYKKIFNSLRQGRYFYTPDEVVNMNGDSNMNKACFKNGLTFRDASEQIKK